jgi:hypothetical protein
LPISNGFFGFWSLLKLAVVFCFFASRAAKYSMANPPPSQLKSPWARQFAGIIAIGTVFLCFPFLIGAATHAGWLFDESINAKITRSMLFAISIGLVLVINGLASGALYAYCFLRYWKPNS